MDREWEMGALIEQLASGGGLEFLAFSLEEEVPGELPKESPGSSGPGFLSGLWYPGGLSTCG